jgi:hypothetical protein
MGHIVSRCLKVGGVMSESKTQAKILKWLDKMDYLTVKIIIANKSGILDIIACSPNGRYIEIEVKFGKNTLSALQEHRLSEVKRRHGVGISAWSLEEVIEGLKEAGERYITAPAN